MSVHSDLIVYSYLKVLIYVIVFHSISGYNNHVVYNDFEQQFDILPDYKLQRYIFPEVIPQSVNEIQDVDEFNSIVVYHLVRINDDDPNIDDNSDSKRAMLIHHGLVCLTNNCEVDKLRITLAYLLVDQNYDVWLSIKDAKTINQTEDTSAEDDQTNKLAQYILSTTGTSELIIMNYFNDSTRFYVFSSNVINDENNQSKMSQLWNGLKNWTKNAFYRGRSYVTNKYEAGINKMSEIGRKLDQVIESEIIRNIKKKILNAYGVMSSLLPKFKIDILSKMLDHPDIYLNTEQLIKKYGYNVEVHEVITQDGYILTLHRMSGGKKYPPSPGKRVIYLQHGLLCSSACWILTGPTHALGYILADNNYDVWMSNSRGSTYSRAHVNLTTSDAAFWNFSFHEIGIYDLPATIDYILDLTERAEYNNKIEKFVAFAPVAYVGNIESPIIQAIAPAGKRVMRLINFFQVNEFLPTHSMMTEMGRQICEARTVSRIFCTSVLSLLNGYDLSRINKTTVPVLMKHLPAGCSTKQIAHFIQEINSKKFRKFDYGLELNIQFYGQPEPHDYKIENILIPVALFYGPNDLLSTSTDVHHLSHKLINLKVNVSVPCATFNHLDFIFGTNAPELIYQPTIDFISLEVV